MSDKKYFDPHGSIKKSAKAVKYAGNTARQYGESLKERNFKTPAEDPNIFKRSSRAVAEKMNKKFAMETARYSTEQKKERDKRKENKAAKEAKEVKKGKKK